MRAKRAKTEIQEEFATIRRETETARESADAEGRGGRPVARGRGPASRRGHHGGRRGAEDLRPGSGDFQGAGGSSPRKLVEEVERLSAVREAVSLERAELERLHKIDVAATALDQMVQDHAREKERLEAEIAEQRAAWEEETRDGERERKEQEENLKKARAREIEEYEYKKNLERKKAQDKYEEDQRLQEKKNKERQETLEKSWQQRETALKEQEQELLRLRKEAQDFPETVKTESEKAAVLAAKAAEQKFAQEILLLKKEAETEKRLASLQVKTLEETIARQAAQIAALQKQMERGQAAGAGHRGEGHRRSVGGQGAGAHQPDRDGAGEASAAVRLRKTVGQEKETVRRYNGKLASPVGDVPPFRHQVRISAGNAA